MPEPQVSSKVIDRDVLNMVFSEIKSDTEGGDLAHTPGLLDELTDNTWLPVDRLREASADRNNLIPIFFEQVTRYVNATSEEREQPTPVFFIFHLLGSWKEKSAYPLLAKLLRSSPVDLHRLLGDAITVTSHRVMAAVFDGNSEILHQLILDPAADCLVRSRMFEALAMLTFQSKIPRSETAAFLRSCFTDLRPEQGCVAWVGWQSATSMLGLVELQLLVKQAFDRGSIDPSWLTYDHFVDDIRVRNENGQVILSPEYSTFGDTIEELSSWSSFQ